MKLSSLSAEPKLIKMEIDSEVIVSKYGEPLEFYTWDRQPMTIFTQLANMSESNDINGLLAVVSELVLEEDGSKILEEGKVLPTDVLMEVIKAITEKLGGNF